MSITRSTGVFCGTDETTGVTLNAGTTTTYTEVDVLANDTSIGEIELFVCVTFGTVAATSGLNIRVNKQRVTGGGYTTANFQFNVASTASTTRKFSLGRMSISRYASVTVQNLDATNSVTNLTVGYELFKVS